MRLAFISSNSCDILKEKCRNGELDMKKVGLVLYGLSFEIDEKKMELHSIFNNRGLIDIIEEFAVANKDNFPMIQNENQYFYLRRWNEQSH